MRELRRLRAQGDGWGENESWATLEELIRAPFDEPRADPRVLGPIWYRQWRSGGALRGSAYDESTTESLLANFGARLVSHAEMDLYVETRADEFAGLDDGECKVFTVVHGPPTTVAHEVNFDAVLTRMRGLGAPDAVRIVWSVGPP